MPGVGVSIEGPTGHTITLTDHDGIFDAKGLRPGHYTVHLATESTTSRIMENQALNLADKEIKELYLSVR